MKNTTIIGIVVVIAILIIILVVGGRPNSDVAQNTASVSPSASASSSPTSSAKPAGTTVAPSNLSYSDAIKKYAGTRIQFDQYCQASPNQITIKKGTSIMLDNRSGDARTISVGSVKYVMAGYGFRIVTPTASVLPATLLIDCGSAQNVGKVIIQK
jgi:hypothetical protein